MERNTNARPWVLLLGLAVIGIACSDDTSGPMFDDLQFTPTFLNIDSARSASFVLANRGETALGPILIGIDINNIRRSTFPDSFCSGAQVTVAPSSISSLAVNETADVDVTLDLSATTAMGCPNGEYDADIAAAVSNQVLGITTIRFDQVAPTP